MKIWGYWATFGWAVLAFLVGQFAGLGLLLWRAPDWSAIQTLPFDGILVTLFILISNPITIAVLAVAVRLARASQQEYFALFWPSARMLAAAVGWLIVLIAVCDAALYFTGHALVTPFQLQSYTSAAAEGWLVPMFAAAILIAPAGEEAMFRGFLYRGWARSERSVWPAIVAISLLWALLHVQYDSTGMLQIFLVGLFLGWMRLRSGSVLLTFVLHALFNLEGTLETLVQVHVFAG
jgi:uncharacterized protein